MKRKIITIDEKKCNGCGICVNACHEGAIQMVDGKAKLISDEYCDGLGDCLPGCPTGAIEIIEREADEYNEEKVKQRMEEKKREEKVEPLACGCPGTMAKMIQKPTAKLEVKKPVKEEVETNEGIASELMQWPVQLNLINPNSKFLDGADLLIAADCTAFAYANFHKDFIKGRITAIGCPKLDDNNYYKEKITQILRDNDIRSIKVIRMTVPCCGGIVSSVKSAMLEANKIIPYSEVIIDVNGEIVQNI